jgi:VWFA-related protein
MKKLTRRTLLTAPLLAAPLAAQQRPAQPAAQPPAPGEDEITTIRATVNVVLVPTTVMYENGQIVNGLKPEDFRLFDNGKLQEISRDVGFLPLSIVVCVQRSVNVEAVLPKIQKMGTVMSDLLIGQEGEAAIIGFDHRVELLQDFTNDSDKINLAMAKLKPGSSSSRLNDAVNQAVFMLRNKKERRRVVLLIAETLDRASESRPKEVATALQVHNVEVYTLNINRLISSLTAKPQLPRRDPIPPEARPRPGVASGDPTTMAQISGAPGYAAEFVPLVNDMFRGVKGLFIDNPAELYTKFTGGREMSFVSQTDLERAISNIGAEIRSQYILSYTPNNKVEGGFHNIKVEVMKPNLKVRTRPGYWMAGLPE